MILATSELATGTIKIYVDGVEDNSVGGSDQVPTINALPIWRVGAPPESWVTDCALFDSIIVQGPILLTTLLALTPTWCYPMENETMTTGSTVQDATPHNNDAVYRGVTGTTLGPGGTYPSLDGTGGRIDTIPAGQHINPVGSTFFCLIHPSSNGSFRTIASTLNAGQYEWDFNYNNSGKLEFTLVTSAGALIKGKQTASAVITTGSWQAVMFTVTGVTTAATITMYLDGSNVGGTVTTGAGSYTNGVADCMVGHRDDGDGFQPWGIVGGVAFATMWNGVVLSPSEIASIFAAAAADGWI